MWIEVSRWEALQSKRLVCCLGVGARGELGEWDHQWFWHGHLRHWTLDGQRTAIWALESLQIQLVLEFRGTLMRIFLRIKQVFFQILDQIWKPNTVFINSKSANIHKSPFKNVFLMIYPNGTVWVNYRVQVKGPCTMDFSAFPMDQQSCHLTLESFSYNNQEVKEITKWNLIVIVNCRLTCNGWTGRSLCHCWKKK